MSNANVPADAAAGATTPPILKQVPIGIDATGTRLEFDSMGTVPVPADRYWGAQTQRSLIHFSIGSDHMPKEVYHAYGYVKKACAIVNRDAGRLPAWKAEAIIQSAEETIAGKLDAHYPLYVWQTGSGTQSNMNVNEVLSSRATQLLGGTIGSQVPVAPNDDVNMGQSSNDTFPTAMHIAAVAEVDDHLLPQLRQLADTVERKALSWMKVVKIGRTHLEDAVPLTVGQEWSGYAAQLRACEADIVQCRAGLLELAVGGTAVGTGLNAPDGFSENVAMAISELTGKAFVTAPNKFMAQGSLDAIVRAHATLRGLSVALMKIANDMRWLASGPRTGLAELLLPQNEPGSSIMPGKVNPTQCEAIVMIAIQVLGDDAGVAFAGSQGNFELNAMRPIIINNFLHSARILADGMEKFRTFSVEGTQLNEKKIASYVSESLMLVTALSPVIGYENSAHIAEAALAKDQTLREAALASGKISAADFDKIVDPLTMIGHGVGGA
jgi:fumarate hydratase class II